MRRIVVTGMGAVSPLGANVGISWSRLLAGQSGIRRLGDDIVGDLPSKIGGVVLSLAEDPEGGFDPDTILAPKDQRKVDRFIILALGAAEEALAQAKWKPISNDDRLRTATIIASGIGGFPAITEAVRTVDQRGVRRLSPFTIPSFLVNLAAGQVSIRHGFKGPLGAPVTACAAGVQAIGDAARLIRANEADIAVCGGTEACMNIVSLGGFAAARSLSAGFNETPGQASRPFDAKRDGFVMGEGAGILVIESLSHALARGARPLAELVGYGTTADAHHITSGPEDGNGARRAMEIAIAQAGISPREIGHLNAHATSTPVGDLGEIRAIKSVGKRRGSRDHGNVRKAREDGDDVVRHSFSQIPPRDQVAKDRTEAETPCNEHRQDSGAQVHERAKEGIRHGVSSRVSADIRAAEITLSDLATEMRNGLREGRAASSSR